MMKPETQHEIAAQRSERIAAHRRLAAFRFGAEEHEANAHLPCRIPPASRQADGWMPSAFGLAVR